MAILTERQVIEIRRSVAQETTLRCDKEISKKAIQSIEDWFETSRTRILSEIDKFTSPFVFTDVEKKRLIKFWLLHKYNMEEK